MKKYYKNKYIVIIMILILIALSSYLSITVYKNYDKKIDIQLSNQIWNTYDDSLITIKNNMESITEPNENFDWWILKDFDIVDDEYKGILNLLVADVRMCYLEYTDDGTLYTKSNPIRKYRDKEFITRKELEKLNFDIYNEIKFGCLKNFDRYNAYLVSNDEELRTKVLNKTNKIFRTKETAIFTNQNATYNELLLRKIMEVHYIEDISAFLVDEYNRLK